VESAVDEVQQVCSMVVQYKYVQSVILTREREPMVMIHNDRQLAKICAFCANKTAGSVLYVDKTYNLGRFYVTVTVYRNLALQCNVTQITPSFIGPHFSTATQTLRLTVCFLDTCLHVCQVVVSQTSISV